MMRSSWAPRVSLVLLALVPAACGAPVPVDPGAAAPSSRVITVALWAGADEQASGVDLAAPVAIERGPVTISGPVHMPDPVSGKVVLAYERVAMTPQGPRRQVLSQTHDGAGLGRVLDERVGLPARQFSGDLIFPLGKWVEGERRSFAATEHTPLGPTRRRITIMISNIDFSYRDVPHSMAYILAINDAAGRVLACERYVYSPGVGLAAFETAGNGLDGKGCSACPCPAAK
jgi:hypothetical protein